jgi:predicted metal-dependent peptidase
MRQELLAKAIKTMILNDPFYGLFLVALNKSWDDKIPTMCVGKNGMHFMLKINEDFFNTLTLEERVAVLKHELLHIGFMHLTDYEHLSNRRIANYAMDLEINQLIKDLPESALTLDTFSELDLEPKAGTKYYYDQLMKKLDEEKDQNENEENENEKQSLSDLLDSLDDPNHDWGDIKDLSPIEKDIMKNQLKEILNSVAETVKKSQGNVPGEFKELLEQLNALKPSKFNWREYIRRFTGVSTKVYSKKSKRKESKRFTGMPGIKVKMRQKILFAIDTSASVNNTELLEMQNELEHLVNLGNDITIIQCDTQIRNVHPYRRKQPLEVYGRGGTDFEPVITYYNENINQYNCLIYYTDGECNRPSDPKGPMLWVISSQSAFNNNLPGKTIKLPN